MKGLSPYHHVGLILQVGLVDLVEHVVHLGDDAQVCLLAGDQHLATHLQQHTLALPSVQQELDQLDLQWNSP